VRTVGALTKRCDPALGITFIDEETIMTKKAWFLFSALSIALFPALSHGACNLSVTPSSLSLSSSTPSGILQVRNGCGGFSKSYDPQIVAVTNCDVLVGGACDAIVTRAGLGSTTITFTATKSTPSSAAAQVLSTN